MANNDALTIDLDDLTIDEIDLVEDILDAPIDSVFDASVRKAPALRALAYVAMRRENPDVTMDEVGKQKLVIGSADPS